MKIKRLIGGNLESNGYIIYDAPGGEGYIIDPGYNAPRFVKEVEALDLTIKGILFTHHHYDHTGAADKVKMALNCPICLNTCDQDIYGDHVDEPLEDGDTLFVGQEEIQVIRTPGHTKGGVCLYCDKSKVVFTGDTIFNVDLGRTDLKDGSEKEMAASVRNIISLWGNDITIYPGHGDPATMKYVRTHNREYLDLIK